MQLPVDVKAVIDEATNIDEARRTPLSVSVYIDNSAPADLQVYARVAFASLSVQARVSILYMDQQPCAPFMGDDMAVVVAGLSNDVGGYAATLRQAGIPVMVVTTLPRLVGDIAQSMGTPIPQGDLISPETSQSMNLLALGSCEQECDSADIVSEPIVLDAEAESSLGNGMGSWIVEVCNDKRLAFALAFPFVRRPLSMEAVKSTSLQNAGVGFFVIIPGADMPVMTLNQAKMLLMIAAAYGEELNLERVKELAAVVGGAFACRAVARQLVAFVPALGWAVKAAIGYSGTLAMGRAAIEYYEDGGNFTRLAEAVGAARDKVVMGACDHLSPETQEAGARAVNAVNLKAVSAANGVRSAAFNVCNSALQNLSQNK